MTSHEESFNFNPAGDSVLFLIPILSVLAVLVLMLSLALNANVQRWLWRVLGARKASILVWAPRFAIGSLTILAVSAIVWLVRLLMSIPSTTWLVAFKALAFALAFIPLTSLLGWGIQAWYRRAKAIRDRVQEVNVPERFEDPLE
jgi:hypothetical protein